MALLRGCSKKSRKELKKKTWLELMSGAIMATEPAALSIASNEILGWDQGRQGLFVSFQFPLFKSHASFKAAVEFHTGRRNAHGRGKKALTRFTSLFLPIIIAFDLLLHPLSILILLGRLFLMVFRIADYITNHPFHSDSGFTFYWQRSQGAAQLLQKRCQLCTPRRGICIYFFL